LRSLRVQLAVAGFMAIYVPVLVMFAVGVLTEDRISETRDGVEHRRTEQRDAPPWAVVTVVALAPAAAGIAWWWAGRAVAPIQHVRSVAEDIELTDLSRRIALARGPSEITALAASFDAMLARLETSAAVQRRLIEETSHELRTPLAVLHTNADVLLAHPEPSLELYRQGLERSKATASRLQATIEELLVDARGRARTLERRPADLVAICRGVLEDVAVPGSATGIELRLTGAAAAPCRLDEPTVRRAIANLVDNAVRHAPPGSTVELDVSVTDDLASIAVTDHGPGIPLDEQPRIFDRFWRGSDDGHGTGLGLPIARQIAHAHGGELTLASPGPAGDGCRFELSVRR
jgi:two-component system OmpR family sensor kinase